MPVVLRLAWRHLSSKPRQTALTVAGVALGVAVFIFTVSMMDGLVVFFTQRLIRTAPLLTVLTERIDALTPRQALTGCEVEIWQEISESLLQLFRMSGTTTCLLTGFVLLVAGLGIASKLTTIILEKERDIAILRAMDFLRFDVRAIYLLQGALLGLLGAALGWVVALVLSVVVCMIAALGPANRAARLEPTAILRGER